MSGDCKPALFTGREVHTYTSTYTSTYTTYPYPYPHTAVAGGSSSICVQCSSIIFFFYLEGRRGEGNWGAGYRPHVDVGMDMLRWMRGGCVGDVLYKDVYVCTFLD